MLVDPIAATRLTVRYGDYQQERDIAGATPDYTAVYKFYPARGRVPHRRTTWKRRRAWCVLGDTAARIYFGNEDPLGKTLYIGDVGFTVVGVMSRKEFFFNDGTTTPWSG